jgi:tetratricopeptide (TPR) repeat protein
MNLNGKQPTFRRNVRRSNSYVVLALLGLLVISLFVLRAVLREEITPPFLNTPIPTRVASSFADEGEAHFFAGDIAQSIEAYKQAVALEPENVQLQAELARILTYSTRLLTTDAERLARLEEALQVIDRAVALDDQDSTVHAVRAFVLDWYANRDLVGEERATELLTEAEQEAIRALTLDAQNVLALAYYAEICIDQMKWTQAEQYAQQALERDPSLMDVHRVYAYVQENLSNYEEAITAYKEAIKITPNLTFLYVAIGVNYRVLGFEATNTRVQTELYIAALEAFSQAVAINERLGVKDSVPYMAIGRTYSQMGKFIPASLNMRAALDFSPENADIYGNLGIVYFKSRNYECSIPALQCAVRGCDAKTSYTARTCDTENSPTENIVITGLPLSNNTVVYYYTYANVLAALHRPYNNNCEEALRTIAEIQTQFSTDELIMGIITPSISICESFGYTMP